MLEHIFYWTGSVVVGAACITVAAGAITGCAFALNRAVRHVLESYGGMKVFLEYREWYHANNKGKP